MTRNDDEIKQLLEDYNRSQLTDRLSQGEIIKLKELIPKMEGTIRDHDIQKLILKAVAAGIPILLALWQIIERLYR